MDMVKPGVTPDEVASVWPDAHEFGYANEDEAFLLQYGHGVGMSLWERPIFSKRFKGQNTSAQGRHGVCARNLEGSNDGSGAARIEEEVVVTKNGCEIITNYPSDHLISCGLPGCEVVA
jgi:Xaa-Pro aminopeptidase